MKKLLLLSLAVLLFSCGDNDDNSSSNVSINPPSWIQGIWINSELQSLGVRLGYEFKTDNFCIVQSNVNNCYKEQVALWTDVDGDNAEVQENITNNSYSIDIRILGGTTSYVFEKVSNSRILLKNANGQDQDTFLDKE
tara:strand:- start:155 stop:568 length:414 start_codon:yes stop_codon:yes gene_type:complete